MEAEWAAVSFANERGFRFSYSMTKQLYNVWRLNLCRWHSTKCETLAKIQDKHVGKLETYNYVQYRSLLIS